MPVAFWTALSRNVSVPARAAVSADRTAAAPCVFSVPRAISRRTSGRSRSVIGEVRIDRIEALNQQQAVVLACTTLPTSTRRAPARPSIGERM